MRFLGLRIEISSVGCFDVFGYKESTRKEKKIRINLVRILIKYGEESKIYV